jgi:hypothetical protein
VKIHFAFAVVAMVGFLHSVSEAQTPTDEWKRIVVQGQRVVELARTLMESADRETRARAEAQYVLGWAIGIEACKGHDQDAVTLTFLKQWEEEWKKGKNVVALSRALAEAQGGRAFLIGDAVTAWGKSTELPVLKTMAYWVSRFGSDEDAEFLESRINQLTDPEQKQILQNGLNWQNYWKDHASGMPAASAPQPG